MPKDDLFIWLFQFLSKDTRIKLLELMEKKATIVYSPHSYETQGLPPAASSPASPTSASTPGAGGSGSGSSLNLAPSSPVFDRPQLARSESLLTSGILERVCVYIVFSI